MSRGGMSDPKNRGTDRFHQKGPVSQDRLLKLMRLMIDLAKSKAASKTRDDARALVRRLMAEANWNTPFILRNLGAKRCRYLSSLGYVLDSEHLTVRPGDIERVQAYADGRRG